MWRFRYNVWPQQKLMMHLCVALRLWGGKREEGLRKSGRQTLANGGFAALRLLLSWFLAGSSTSCLVMHSTLDYFPTSYPQAHFNEQPMKLFLPRFLRQRWSLPLPSFGVTKHVAAAVSLWAVNPNLWLLNVCLERAASICTELYSDSAGLRESIRSTGWEMKGCNEHNTELLRTH